MSTQRVAEERRSNISERGVRLLSDEDGYHFSLSVTIPPKEVVAHIMRGRLRRGVNFVVNGMYPLSHLFAIVFSAGASVAVAAAALFRTAQRGVGAAAAAPPPPPPPPAGGWEEVRTPDGKVYYHNTATGQTSWTPPGAGAPPPPPPPPGSAPSAPSAPTFM